MYANPEGYIHEGSRGWSCSLPRPTRILEHTSLRSAIHIVTDVDEQIAPIEAANEADIVATERAQCYVRCLQQ